MDNSIYRHFISKIKKSNAVAHHNFPSHNLLSIENLFEVSVDSIIAEDDTQFLGSMPCYQKFPYAISRSSPCFSGSGVTDDACDLVRKKLKWQKDLKNCKLDNVDKAIKQIKDLQKNKSMKLSGNLKKYVDHICDDPEPMFFGNYNWLYSCGTLHYVEAFNGAIIISADVFDNRPGFNVLKLDENSDEIYNKCSSVLKTSPVLQITSKCKEDNLMICVRQKNYLNLFSFSKTDCLSQPLRLWRKKVNPPKLIICADIKSSCEEVLLSDSKHDLHVFHTERKNKIYGCVGRKICPDLVRDPWSQVEFGDLGIYVAFRNCFVILDPRDLNSTTLEYTPSHALNNCEDICSFVKSPSDPNFIYLGTTHSILQLDVRNGETVQKWTHLMKKPPQFMAVTKDGQDNEFLVLQSQDVGEVLGIINEPLKRGGDKTNFLSKSLPCLLSSVKESLMMARYHGVCLSPFLAERINFSITGMQCVKNNAGDINIFINNSAGDIFLSKVHKTETLEFTRQEDERRTVQSMKIYEAQVQNLPLKHSTGSHLQLTDMSHVLKGLRSSKPTPQKMRKAEFNWKYHEMYSPESLKSCTDVLAQNILSVWGYEADDSAAADTDDTMSVEEKVRQWMSRN